MFSLNGHPCPIINEARTINYCLQKEDHVTAFNT
jgi:hypothetical protein